MFLFIFFVVYLSILITDIFKNDKKLYVQLDNAIVQNEIRFHDFSYWISFKKLYLCVEYPTTKKFSQKTTTNREYSTTSLKTGPIWTAVKGAAGKKLIAAGGKLAPAAAPKVATGAANSAVTIGSQGLTAAGTGAVVGLGAAGGLVLTGGDQMIRYVGENAVNSATQPNHKWPPFKMESPADVWLHGSKK